MNQPQPVAGGQMARIDKLLIANRGEIALRIARSAADKGICTVAIRPADDAASRHALHMDECAELPGAGVRAYLDIDAVVDAAVASGADAVHPGYGFLAENAEFARRVEAAGLIFVGPTPESLALFGDKLSAKALARRLDVPVLPGTDGETTFEEAEAFRKALPDGARMLIKAVAGGGGRGMRVVGPDDDLQTAWDRCRSEAKAAFGNPGVYIERFLPAARHIEVQILGDGQGTCVDFGERECTLQRRHQKVVEIAPSPSLSDSQRQVLMDRALKLARDAGYRSLGTFEFLLSEEGLEGEDIFFIEANPRIQVEHTVTEEIHGIDLVDLQLDVAMGRSLPELGMTAAPALRGHAIQLRVNMERMDAKAQAMPTGGQIEIYEPPTGAGIRVDGFAYAGYTTSAHYDSLLAKLIVHSKSGDFAAALARAARALAEFRIVGLDTNIPWLRALLDRPEVQANKITTRFIETHAAELAEAAGAFAVSALGSPTETQGAAAKADVPDGSVAVPAPMQATVVSMSVGVGDIVCAGQQLAILDAMKMEHVVSAPQGGRITALFAAPGETVRDGAVLVSLDPADGADGDAVAEDEIDLDHIRPDLQEVIDRRAYGLDGNRSEAVKKRHGRGHQTARENLSQICDDGTFVEYGEFAVAAQIQRREMQDLIENTSGDGILTGLGTVNGDRFPDSEARCAFAIGDYMVLAGTQGQRHHRKLDRILHVAGDWNIPLVLFAEGGGGRPGDTERFTYAGISTKTFSQFASLSGKVPMVGIVSGRCFAGNAALLGCCDVIIADESANIGMAGPAMIEGGGLGIYPPEAIGPIDEQCANGVVDIRVTDEAEACAVARQYLSYFQGPVADWTAPDPRRLRHVVPENRLRVYEVRDAIDGIADEGSVLELRREFGVGIVTAFIRIEGMPFGIIANNPRHLGGAIDGPASDKASRFMQLCDAFDIPLVSLCDTPGFMVGPEYERTGLVRHVCRMFVTARSLSVPMFSVVLRKCYGLGAQGMVSGGTYDNFFTVSWPTGEFGPMGLEGAVTLGFRRELEAVTDPDEKKALYDKLVAEMYEQGKALKVAQTLEIDAVIDPVDTRNWILAGLRSTKLRPPLSGQKRPMVDTW
tara:strand:- start:260 stop:3586 length:3327 start_codon:yes stop_codon:yes gene_type:complete